MAFMYRYLREPHSKGAATRTWLGTLKTFGARLVQSSALRWANYLTLGYLCGPVSNDCGRRFTRNAGIGGDDIPRSFK